MFKTMTAIAAAGVVALGAMTTAHAEELTIISWGGAYTASQQKAYHDPYTAKTGVKIINDDSASEGMSKLRAQMETGNLTWDVIDMIASDSITACDEGLIEEIDPAEWLAPAPDGTPASEDFFKGTLTPGGTNCFIPQIVYSNTFGYRSDMVGSNPPTTIADVFDLKKYPGKRALQKRPFNNLEWALLADGVPDTEVYEMLSTEAGVKRAFAKLDTIKDQVVWWVKGAQPPQLLADGEVVMASAYNGRLFNAIAVENQPIGMMWDRQIFDLDGWVIPKDHPKMAEIKKYIYFATDTQRLADQAKFISYGPARYSSAPLVGNHAELGIDMKPHMPTDPNNASNTFDFDYVWWADHTAEMDERFNAWLAK